MLLNSIVIRLFGRPTVEIDGRIITNFRSHRIPALLGYLGWKGSARRRDEIIAALWPDAEETQGRHNLRQTVFYARQLLGDRALISDREEISIWDGVLVDCRRFEAAALDSPEIAIADYTGPFLPSLFDDWIEEPRARYAALHVEALVRLGEARLAADPESSLKLARLAVAEDEYNERARAIQIRALRARGETVAAQREYEAFVTMLDDELSIAPSRIVEEARRDPIIQEPQDPKRSTEAVEFERIALTLAAGRRPSEAVEFVLGLVPYWFSAGRSSEGLEVLEAVLATVGPKISEASCDRAILGRAQLHLSIGALSQVATALDAVIPRLIDPRDRVRASIIRARVELIRHRPDASLQFAERALVEATRNGLVEEELEALVHTGKTVFLHQEFSKSIDYLRRASEAADKLASSELKAEVYISLAFSYSRSNDVTSAREFADRAHEEIGKIASIRRIHLEVGWARAREELGDIEVAEAGYRRGCAEYEASNLDFWHAICRTYLADLLESQGHSIAALAEHERALALRRPTGDALGVATSLRGIGRSRMSIGDFFGARSAFADSARLFRGEDAIAGYASALCGLGQVEARIGDAARARKILARAMRLLVGLPPSVKLEIGPTGAEWIEQTRRTLEQLN